MQGIRLRQRGTFQRLVANWFAWCFGESARTADLPTRNYRFLEEALELVQANGVTREEVLALVDYTYNRPPGTPHQEVGGVEVTLAALCETLGIDKEDAADRELERISQPDIMEKIRRKQASKPNRSPLPGVAP